MKEKERKPATSARDPLPALAAWLGLGAAGGFFVWTLGLAAGGAGAPPAALASYAKSLLAGLAASGIAVALAPWAMAGAWLARASYASCALYAGFLTTLGWQGWPWLLLAAAAGVLALLRRSDLSHAARELLLLHAMGTLGALYASFQLPTFLAAWPAFRETFGGLWLVLTSIGS
jgi:hypothetical protein